MPVGQLHVMHQGSTSYAAPVGVSSAIRFANYRSGIWMGSCLFSRSTNLLADLLSLRTFIWTENCWSVRCHPRPWPPMLSEKLVTAEVGNPITLFQASIENCMQNPAPALGHSKDSSQWHESLFWLQAPRALSASALRGGF